jgi:beta-glucosidase
VVHGFRTIFPVPIGQAASFNLDLISRAERVAALEATAAGINWTFAPVLDMARDPRWGRMVETAGESPWYTAAVGQARVRAFQGDQLSDPSSMLACAKHFVGNGATEGGREYTGTNLSFRSMRDNELPPFEAAVKAGIGCIMPAFNAVDGVPGIVNQRMLSEVLRKEWRFEGLVVTDHGAIAELPNHGVAANLSGASRAAIVSGVDMDMASMGFGPTLPDAVRSGALDEALLDQACCGFWRSKSGWGCSMIRLPVMTQRVKNNWWAIPITPYWRGNWPKKVLFCSKTTKPCCHSNALPARLR